MTGAVHYKSIVFFGFTQTFDIFSVVVFAEVVCFSSLHILIFTVSDELCFLVHSNMDCESIYFVSVLRSHC